MMKMSTIKVTNFEVDIQMDIRAGFRKKEAHGVFLYGPDRQPS
jgi:hypothetical protein